MKKFASPGPPWPGMDLFSWPPTGGGDGINCRLVRVIRLRADQLKLSYDRILDGLSIEWTRWSWCCWRRPGLAAKKSGIGCRVALSLKLETSRRQFFPVWQKIGGRLQRLPARQGRVAGVCKQKWQRRRFDVAVAKDHVGFASVAQHIYIPTYSKGVAFPFLTRAFGILFPIKRF